jgi:hypothetical protein
MGVWLLTPEYLRLGIWDLLVGWSGKAGACLQPRLALQLVQEAALCVTGVRDSRALVHKGFEAANGLPFLASDQAVHDLLAAHTVPESQALQVALGIIRRASGHFNGRLLAIDPHFLRSHSRRQMVRKKEKRESQPYKSSQGFFCLDAETEQPVTFTLASSAQTVAQATPPLLALAEDILAPLSSSPLVLADTQHFTAQLFEHVLEETPFDLMVPEPRRKLPYQRLAQIDPAAFTPRWAGFATASGTYRFVHSPASFHHIVQRCGEREDEYRFKGFISTRPGREVEALSVDYPRRWHVEEFFNKSQALGWKRAGTLNLNIRYGQMTMALLAQASLHQLRKRLGEPFDSWEASHFAKNLLAGLDGDLRVTNDTILVTYYNAPNAERLSRLYQNLPQKLEREGVNPRIPWLYDYKLDFRFR